MIDIQHEQLITLTEAARLMPRRRMDKPVSRATLLRWHTLGRNGVTLETVRLPGGHATSVEALQRFIDRLTKVCLEEDVFEPNELEVVNGSGKGHCAVPMTADKNG